MYLIRQAAEAARQLVWELEHDLVAIFICEFDLVYHKTFFRAVWLIVTVGSLIYLVNDLAAHPGEI